MLEVVDGGAGHGRTRSRRTSARSGSPTSARRQSYGIAAPAARCTTRSTGRTPAPTSSAASCLATAVRTASARRPGCRSPPTSPGPKVRWLLDQRPGPARARGGGRGAVRHDRLVADLEPVRPPRHRRDQRQPDDADEPAQRASGTTSCSTAVGVPRAMLPEIRPSSEIYGEAGAPLAGVPVASLLGDQHAALVGQTCFDPGDAKCTYGTGSFFLLNTGEQPARSESRAADARWATTWAPGSRRTRWRARSRSPARWCSGSATTSG